MKWQPIETAPRDGSRILVCGGDVYEIQIASLRQSGEVLCECNEMTRMSSDPPDFPAYWMPLPSPPTATPHTA